MIERLVTSLRELAAASPAEVASDATARVRGDCADALRLELDCPQQSLTPSQRSTLVRLSDVLDDQATPAFELLTAVRAAVDALGIAAHTGSDRYGS
jgi:hypothetical protein